MDEDVDQEAFYSDFKVDSDGIRRPRRSCKAAGLHHHEINDLKTIDSLPDSLFTKPGE